MGFEEDPVDPKTGRSANCGGIRLRCGRKPTPRSQKSTSRSSGQKALTGLFPEE
jgi:hypothetical protein